MRYDLILTKAWRPPPQCRQWSNHCLGDTNTFGNRTTAAELITIAGSPTQTLTTNPNTHNQPERPKLKAHNFFYRTCNVNLQLIVDT